MVRDSSFLSLVAVGVVGCTPAPVPVRPSPSTPPRAAVVPASSGPGVSFLDTAPPDALTLDVRVKRWSCEITDPDGVLDEELHFPLGRAVRLRLRNEAAEDLDVELEKKPIHLPHGSTNELVFRAGQKGDYGWRCPVRRGPEGRLDLEAGIFAHAPSEYAEHQRWQSEQTRPTTREGRIRLGKEVYEKKGCNACHTDDGSPRVGVTFAGLWGTRVTLADGSTRTVDEQFIKDSLVNPRVIRQAGYRESMPSFEGVLRPEEIEAVAVYVETLAASK